MNTQLMICLIICAITVAFYIYGKFPWLWWLWARWPRSWSPAVSTVLGAGLLGNNNGIMIMSMFGGRRL